MPDTTPGRTEPAPKAATARISGPDLQRLEAQIGAKCDQTRDELRDAEAAVRKAECGTPRQQRTSAPASTTRKHATAVLSGIGSRLDESPERLFLLRGIDETELNRGRSCSVMRPGGDRRRRTCRGKRDGGENTAESRPLNVPGASSSKALPASPPISTDSATSSRPVKKTLTYRPPAPTAADRPRAPSDPATEAAGFVPTGEMVADLRAQCGCPVAEFADLIQITPATVRRWESTAGPLNLHAAPWEALRALYLESRQQQG